jgi:hypothetical protein
MAVGDGIGAYFLCLKSRSWRDAPQRRSLLLKAESRSSSGAIIERSDQRFVPFTPWREKFSNLARKARVA